MRISDWSSDVCSSDLVDVDAGGAGRFRAVQVAQVDAVVGRQRTRQLAARVVAERADERRARAGARTGHGLVEALAARPGGIRSEERRGGKEWVSTCRSRRWPDHSKKKKSTKS